MLRETFLTRFDKPEPINSFFSELLIMDQLGLFLVACRCVTSSGCQRSGGPDDDSLPVVISRTLRICILLKETSSILVDQLILFHRYKYNTYYPLNKRIEWIIANMVGSITGSTPFSPSLRSIS